ncbi:MAG: hypothetical protein AB7T49_08020 [Oligoflexales bacterium]
MNFVLSLTFIFILIGCAKPQSEKESASPVNYGLEREYTHLNKNAIIFETAGSEDYLFSIHGDGFSSDVELDKKYSVRDRTELSYEDLGGYNVDVTIYQADGTMLVKESLGWEYNTEGAPDPIADFSEIATNDSEVVLLVSGSRGPRTKELWIEGDLRDYPDGNWFEIPETDLLPLHLTEEDGIKTIRVKHRNIYGIESEQTHTLKILKKSVGPSDCNAAVVAEKTPSAKIRMKFEATNSGSLYYNVFGDVGEVGDFTKFEDSTKADIALSAGEGEKFIIAKIKDVAENYCDSFPITVEYDKAHDPESIAIEDDLLWTDDQLVTLELNYDHFEGEATEMYIYGSVENFGDVRQWVPLSSTTQIMLSATEGHRFVRAKFRDAEEVETLEQYVGIFLKPFIRFQNIGGTDYVLLSNIQSLTSLKITGCTQTYNNVAYEGKLPCTPVGGPIQVTYYLTDGTNVVKSVVP